MSELAYVLSLAMCAVVVASGRGHDAARGGVRALFWPAVCALLLGLLALKLADAVILADQEGRRALWLTGLYDDRREIQAWIIAAIAVAAVLLFLIVARWINDLAYVLPLAAVTTLCAFIAVRALSLHQVDSLLYDHHLAGLHSNDFAETALVLAVGVSAYWFQRKRAATSRGRWKGQAARQSHGAET